MTEASQPTLGCNCVAHDQLPACLPDPRTPSLSSPPAQEFGDLEAALADPKRAAYLRHLPAQALVLLFQSPELRVWNEGAVLAGASTEAQCSCACT